MANTYTCLHYHDVFSTKNREPCITQDVEDRVWAYMAGIGYSNRMVPLIVGGVEDHVHMVLGLPPTLAPSIAVQLIKGGSSKWAHEVFPEAPGCGWQDGYGAFSVSRTIVPAVVRYVQGQRNHHRDTTFQEEFRDLLDQHGIDYDERYMWG